MGLSIELWAFHPVVTDCDYDFLSQEFIDIGRMDKIHLPSCVSGPHKGRNSAISAKTQTYKCSK